MVSFLDLNDDLKGGYVSNYAIAASKRPSYQSRPAAPKRSKRDVAFDAFKIQYPDFIPVLESVAKWADIGRSIHTQLMDRGVITENQVNAILRIAAKAAATQEAKRAEKESRNVAVDLSPIHAMFDKAKENGLNKLAYRAEGLVLTPAKATSANPGAIYVRRGDEYVGKVVDKVFKPVFAATEADKEALNVIAANPADAAVRYGRKTGSCSCCGRELTNKVSIELGIGPICYSKWF